MSKRAKELLRLAKASRDDTSSQPKPSKRCIGMNGMMNDVAWSSPKRKKLNPQNLGGSPNGNIKVKKWLAKWSPKGVKRKLGFRNVLSLSQNENRIPIKRLALSLTEHTSINIAQAGVDGNSIVFQDVTATSKPTPHLVPHVVAKAANGRLQENESDPEIYVDHELQRELNNFDTAPSGGDENIILHDVQATDVVTSKSTPVLAPHAATGTLQENEFGFNINELNSKLQIQTDISDNAQAGVDGNSIVFQDVTAASKPTPHLVPHVVAKAANGRLQENESDPEIYFDHEVRRELDNFDTASGGVDVDLATPDAADVQVKSTPQVNTSATENHPDDELQRELDNFERVFGVVDADLITSNEPEAEFVTPGEPDDVLADNDGADDTPLKGRMSRPREPKVSTRKRSRNLFKWRSTIAKEALAKGEEHLNVKGQLIRARKMGAGCGLNCRFKCHQHITQQQRDEIFIAFWKIEDHSRKWDFINKHTTVTSPKERKNTGDSPSRKRNHTRTYHFNIGDKVVKICRTMFLSTLDVSEQYLKTATAKFVGHHAISPDKRGKHGNHRATPLETKQSVRDHINSLPRVPSHYCRAKSMREYLEAGLSVSKLHEMYEEWMQKLFPNKNKASKRTYQDIFNTEFNISFHKPKKDQCDVCLTYEKKLNDQQKIRRKAEYELHIKRKEEARKVRSEDKARAESDPSICFATFDLQKVLTCPKDKGGAMFYVSKLSVYNFTVWDATKREGFCYVWHEGEAHRGANEVASAVLLFIDHMARNHNIVEFLFWSDNCSGQNKNKYLFSMYTYASAKYGVKITHRYLEKGHTENAGDAMHSCIERFAKEKRLYCPQEWYDTILHSSKKTIYKLDENNKKICEKVPAYKVTKLAPLVFDFHYVAESLQKWSYHREVHWKQVRELTISDCKNPHDLSVKHDLRDQSVNISVLKKTQGRPLQLKNVILQKAYNGPIQLKAKKLKFLWNLCKQLIIPVEYHDFYKSLIGFPDLAQDPEDVDIAENLERIAQENDLAQLLDEMREDDIDVEEWLADADVVEAENL